MLKHKEANPLAIANMRRMDFLPPHFEKIKFDIKVGEKVITDWIYENTEGRFFVGPISEGGNPMPPPTPVKNPAGGWLLPPENYSKAKSICHCVAFEIHAETTYFTLFLDQINKPNYEY